MAKRIVIIVLASVLFFSWCKVTKADEIGDLKQQLAEQNKMLQELQQKIGKLESSQQEQEKVIDEKVTKAVDSKKPALPESMKWVENVRLSGDFRFRYENISDEDKNGKNNDDYNRNRIRARIGISAKVNDDWDLGFRLATGSSPDPVSTNQTLDGSFSKKSLWIDQAFAAWHPKGIEGLTAWMGKIPQPFYRAGNNQLVWDDDLNPEGAAFKYVFPIGDADKLNLVAGGFWINSDNSSTSDAISLWGIQPYWEHTFNNKSKLVTGISMYDFSDVQGKASLYDGKFYGNSNASSKFTQSYIPMEGFAEYQFNMGNRPMSIYGSYINNTEADNNKDTGWLAGFTYNKAKDPNTWEIGYNYRDVKADATVGLFSDSDFCNGGTDGKGHLFSFKYQFTKNLQGGLSYFMDEKFNSSSTKKNTDYDRLQADIIFKF